MDTMQRCIACFECSRRCREGSDQRWCGLQRCITKLRRCINRTACLRRSCIDHNEESSGQRCWRRWCCKLCEHIRVRILFRTADQHEIDNFFRYAEIWNDISDMVIPIPEQMQFEEFFRISSRIGDGGSGVVLRGVPTELGLKCLPSLEGGRTYAVKKVRKEPQGEVIDRSLLTVSAQRHVEILKSMVNPENDRNHLVQDFGYFGHAQNVYVVMELLNGPDLFDWLTTRYLAVEEVVAANVARQILSAVHYIHRSIGVLHRDIKLENFGFATPVPSGSMEPLPRLKLFDLGLSWALPELVSEASAASLVKLDPAGTWMYMSPETWSGWSGPPSDVWGIGIIMYMVLSLSAPFSMHTCTTALQYENASCQGLLEFNDDCWATVSSPARSFVSGLLARDFEKRLSTSQAFHNSWLLAPPLEPSPAEPSRIRIDGVQAQLSFPARLKKTSSTMMLHTLLAKSHSSLQSGGARTRLRSIEASIAQ